MNADIKQLSREYKTVVPKDIVLLLFAEMLEKKEREVFLAKHTKSINIYT